VTLRATRLVTMTHGRVSVPPVTIFMALHGEFKAGKSWFAQTGEAPTLLIESEHGGSAAASSRQIGWDWTRFGPPVHDGQWDTAVARISTLDEMDFVLQRSRSVPWQTIAVDSISDIASRTLRAQAGPNGANTIHHYARLKQQLTAAAQDAAARAHDPGGPFTVWLCRSILGDDGVMRPHIAGSFRTDIAYEVDLIAHITGSGPTRQLICAEHPGYVAGHRLGPTFPSVITDVTIGRVRASAQAIGGQDDI